MVRVNDVESHSHIPYLPRYFQEGDYDIQPHGYEELRDDAITIGSLEDAIGGDAPEVIEDYPLHQRGACCLLLAWPSPHEAIHVVVAYWAENPIVVTAYRPDSEKWEEGFRIRRS